MKQFTQKIVGLDCFDHRISHDSIVSHTIKVMNFLLPITLQLTPDLLVVSLELEISNLLKFLGTQLN